MSNKIKSIYVVLLALTFAASAQAEEKKASGETSIKIEDVNKEAEQSVKKSSENDEADQVITNKKMRAETGSLSKWSVSTAFNYQGGSIEKPTDAVRPDLASSGEQPALASVDGVVGIKYRTSKLTSLTLGVGLSMMTPFNESTHSNDPDINADFKKYDDKLQAANPNLTFTALSKLSGIQSVTQLGSTMFTQAPDRDRGNLATLELSQVFAYDIGTTGLSLGMNFAATHQFFDKAPSQLLNGDQVGGMRSDNVLGVYPFIEYVINDTFNIRTISGLWVYRHVDAETNPWKFKKTPIYQSVGVGISINRDIYLYPNVQFLPEDIRADKTNVAFNTNFNIF